jgi:hypothetical protein
MASGGKRNVLNREKVLKYENFLNDQLRPDLRIVLEQRDKIYEESSEYLALKNSIAAIKSSELPKGRHWKYHLFFDIISYHLPKK